MDTEAYAKGIRAMHQEIYLIAKIIAWREGRFGGPNTYEKFGHPRLRMRHMPFSIDTEAAQEWMACMNQALEEQVESLGSEKN